MSVTEGYRERIITIAYLHVGSRSEGWWASWTEPDGTQKAENKTNLPASSVQYALDWAKSKIDKQINRCLAPNIADEPTQTDTCPLSEVAVTLQRMALQDGDLVVAQYPEETALSRGVQIGEALAKVFQELRAKTGKKIVGLHTPDCISAQVGHLQPNSLILLTLENPLDKLHLKLLHDRCKGIEEHARTVLGFSVYFLLLPPGSVNTIQSLTLAQARESARQIAEEYQQTVHIVQNDVHGIYYALHPVIFQEQGLPEHCQIAETIFPTPRHNADVHCL